jgi:Protein of unknown function (DUF1653)
MTEMSPKPNEVSPGQTWFHQGRTEEPYIILKVPRNAAGFESTGEITQPPIVVYEQRYDGEVAKTGEIWARPLPDFLGSTEVNGQTIPNFVRKEE